MLKVFSIVGARPQFIKAAVVSRALRKESDVEEYLAHTGQHYDAKMSDVFFDELSIPHPDINLGVNETGHARQTAQMLIKLEAALLEQKPDIVLLYGDTNSTLAGALSAAKLNIPVAHIEAGLRSFNKNMPEEINRITTDHCSDILFSVSPVSSENLLREGVTADNIIEAGDVMFDAVLYYAAQARENSTVLNQLKLEERSYILATIHRQENTDDTERLRTIFESLVGVAKKIPVVLPLHPRTRKTLAAAGMLESVTASLTLSDPVGYFDMLELQRNSAVVVTDSGGMQKEAYYLEVPGITLRDQTEWVELVEQNFNLLLSPTMPSTDIVDAILGRAKKGFQKESEKRLYGGGDAGLKIVAALIERYAN